MNQCIAWVGHKAEVYNVLIVARTISQVLKPKINLDLDQSRSKSQAKNGNMFTLKSLWSIRCVDAEGPTQAVSCNQDILCLLMFFITIFCSDWRSVSIFFHLPNLFNNLFSALFVRYWWDRYYGSPQKVTATFSWGWSCQFSTIYQGGRTKGLQQADLSEGGNIYIC